MTLNRIVSLAVFLLFGANIYAQVAGGSPEFQKLFDLYAMDRIEDCLWKADRYTDKDKTRRSPEPYLYMSMCYYKIHQNIDDYDAEVYRRPLKQALKYAYKFVRKDKENELVPQNKAYLDEMMLAGIKEANFHAIEEDYRKSAYFLKKVMKIDDSNPNIQLAMGLHQFASRNRGEGARNIKAALEKIQEESDLSKIEINESLEPLITKGVLLFKDMKKMNDMNEELTERTVDVCKRIFEEDEMFIAQLNGEEIESIKKEHKNPNHKVHYSEGAEEE